MTYPTYKDDFETGQLDPLKWHSRQVPDPERQIQFSNDAASGAKSVTVQVTDGDGGIACKDCQRAEIRTHGRLRPLHTDTFWHGFSFRASGDIPTYGSIRTVLSQWKAPGDDSPFLALRFDNGVFHITVQDGPARRTVASAFGDPDRLDRAQDLLTALTQTDPATLHAARALAELRAYHPTNAGGTAAQASTLAQDLAQAAQKIAAVGMSDPQGLLDEISYLHDLDAYAQTAKLRTTRSGPRMLPDPKEDWVRMAFRIRAGRTDNNPQYTPQREGEVDIYANGSLIAQVRGDIGYRVTKPPSHEDIYFKFGVYRDRMPGTLTLHFDNFAQGTQAEDVM